MGHDALNEQIHQWRSWIPHWEAMTTSHGQIIVSEDDGEVTVTLGRADKYRCLEQWLPQLEKEVARTV